MGLDFKKAGICLGLFLSAGISAAQDRPARAAGDAAVRARINAGYREKVLPILRQSCFACHGPQPQDTDHVADPAAQKKMVKLIKRAKRRFPMFESFPYPEDDDPADSLRRLEKSMRKNSMPPEKAQNLFEMGEPLSPKDRKVLLDWAGRGLREMKTK